MSQNELDQNASSAPCLVCGEILADGHDCDPLIEEPDGGTLSVGVHEDIHSHEKIG